MADAKDPVWYYLEKINSDIDKMEDRWASHLVTSTKLVENLQTVSDKVLEMNRLLTKDNGKPSILTQLGSVSVELNSVSNEIKNVRDILGSLKEDVEALKEQVGVKTPKEVSVERAKTAGVIVTALAATLPGILSFIHSFLM